MNVRAGHSWITLKRRCHESLPAFGERCEEAAALEEGRQREAENEASLGLPTVREKPDDVASATRELRGQARKPDRPPQVEERAALCRWCFLPVLAHCGGSSAQCARRQLPATASLPPPGARGSDARLEYSRCYSAKRRALERAADAALATATDNGPPPHDLATITAPGGKRHCGGNLAFTGLTLVGDQFKGKMPLFVMQPQAVAAFDGRHLTHATTEHHTTTRAGHGAHVSYAVQTQAPTLGLTSARRRAVAHREMLAMGTLDAVEEFSTAVWLSVTVGEQRHPLTEAAQAHLEHNDETMHTLRWKRIVLYNALTGQPLVIYDAEGIGLPHHRRLPRHRHQPSPPPRMTCHQRPLHSDTTSNAIDGRLRPCRPAASPFRAHRRTRQRRHASR